jgi:hypothetical protein
MRPLFIPASSTPREQLLVSSIGLTSPLRTGIILNLLGLGSSLVFPSAFYEMANFKIGSNGAVLLLCLL